MIVCVILTKNFISNFYPKNYTGEKNIHSYIYMITIIIVLIVGCQSFWSDSTMARFSSTQFSHSPAVKVVAEVVASIFWHQAVARVVFPSIRVNMSVLEWTKQKREPPIATWYIIWCIKIGPRGFDMIYFAYRHKHLCQNLVDKNIPVSDLCQVELPWHQNKAADGTKPS